MKNRRARATTAARVEIVFTPTAGDPVSAAFSYARAAPQNGRVDYCTYHYEKTFPDGVTVFDGSASISYTP